MKKANKKMQTYKRSANGDLIKDKEIDFMTCEYCNTDFPILQGVLCCNGVAIINCPFCKK